MTTEPLEAVRDHLSEIVDRVELQHERVVITRNGHAAAVLISAEDLAQLEETVSVLADPEALADIRQADAAYVAGDVVRGVDAVQRLQRLATASHEHVPTHRRGGAWFVNLESAQESSGDIWRRRNG